MPFSESPFSFSARHVRRILTQPTPNTVLSRICVGTRYSKRTPLTGCSFVGHIVRSRRGYNYAEQYKGVCVSGSAEGGAKRKKHAFCGTCISIIIIVRTAHTRPWPFATASAARIRPGQLKNLHFYRTRTALYDRCARKDERSFADCSETIVQWRRMCDLQSAAARRDWPGGWSRVYDHTHTQELYGCIKRTIRPR